MPAEPPPSRSPTGNSGSNQDTGTYSVASGASVDFAGGTRTIGAATFTGTGPVHVDNRRERQPTPSASPTCNSTAAAPSAARPRSPSPAPSASTAGRLYCAAHLVNQGVATENASGSYTIFNNSSILENAIGGTLNLTDGSRASITAIIRPTCSRTTSAGRSTTPAREGLAPCIEVAMTNAGTLALSGNNTLYVEWTSFDNSGTVNAGGTTTFEVADGQLRLQPGHRDLQRGQRRLGGLRRRDAHHRGRNLHRHRTRPRRQPP